MKITARIISVLIAFLLIFRGVQFMFFTKWMLSTSFISADSTFGLSNVRTLIAGPLFMSGIFAFIAAIFVKKEALYVVALTFILMSLSRIISILSDGFEMVSLRGAMIAFVLFIITSAAIWMFTKAKQNIS